MNESTDTAKNESPRSEGAEDVAKVGELLAKLGPEGTLGVIAELSKQIGAHAKKQGDGEQAERWRTSAEAIGALASNLANVDEDEDDTATQDEGDDGADGGDAQEEDDALEDDDAIEEEDEEEPARAPERHFRRTGASDASGGTAQRGTEPPREGDAHEPRKVKMKTVAGHFRVSPKVKLCRLRRVSETGERGELLGRENEHGFEETEWKIEAITAERLRTWFGPGRYQFEWYGEAEQGGGRIPLGRTQPFRVFDGRGKKPEPVFVVPPPSPAPMAIPSGNADTLALMKFMSEMHERERAHEREERRFREELASKERIAQMEAQAKIAAANARAVVVGQGHDSGEEEDGDDTEAASQGGMAGAAKQWMDTLGLTPEMVQMVVGGILEKLNTPTAGPSPYAMPFVPKAGGEPPSSS